MDININVNSIDRTDKVLFPSLSITDTINHNKDTATFSVRSNEPWTYPFINRGQWVGNLNYRGQWENLAELNAWEDQSAFEAWEPPTDPATLPNWEGEAGTMTFEGDTYNVVGIGGQKWTKENLKYLPSVNAVGDDSGTVPKYYVLNYNGTNVTTAKATSEYEDFGVLYNKPAFEAFTLPAGWVVPSDGEWKTLEGYLGMTQSDQDSIGSRSSGNVGQKLKAQAPDFDGTDIVLFSALPGKAYQGSFFSLERGHFWSRSAFGSTSNFFRMVAEGENSVLRAGFSHETALSVRLLSFWKENDEVQHNGIAYKCLVDDTLEEPGTGTDWELIDDFYNQNDTVTHIDAAWQSDTDTNISEPPTDWTNITYQTGDRLQHIGQFWQSETDDNLSEPPTDWTDIGYKVGDEVQHNSSRWACQVDDTTEEPGTGDDWLQVPTYNINDLVRHQSQRWYSLTNNNTDEPGQTGTWKSTELAPEPRVDDEIIITDNGTRMFAGAITGVSKQTDVIDSVIFDVECTDYSFYLDRKLVLERFRNQTVNFIVDFLLDKYDDEGFTINNVQGEQRIGSITFNRITLSECLQKLADVTGFSWYVDYHKDIHFFPRNAEPAPFELTDAGSASECLQKLYVWNSLQVTNNINQIRNIVIVEGGEERGNERTEEFTASGDKEERTFYRLANKFAETPVVTVNGTPVDVGAEFLSDDGTVDCQWSFQEKYIRFTDGNIPAVNDVVDVTGIPLFPVVVRVNDPTSIAQFGDWEFVVRDNTIQSREQALQRAFADLQAYRNGVVEGRVRTYTPGLRSGQILTANSPSRNIDEEFLIQRVFFTARTPFDGEWQVELATLRTITLIDFLQNQIRDRGVREGESETLLTFLQFDDSATASDTIDNISVTSPPYHITDSDGNVTVGTPALVNYSKMASSV